MTFNIKHIAILGMTMALLTSDSASAGNQLEVACAKNKSLMKAELAGWKKIIADRCQPMKENHCIGYAIRVEQLKKLISLNQMSIIDANLDADQNRVLKVDYQCNSKKTTMSISNAELFETETAPAQITTYEQENKITITSKNRVLELYLMRGPVAILKKDAPSQYEIAGYHLSNHGQFVGLVKIETPAKYIAKQFGKKTVIGFDIFSGVKKFVLNKRSINIQAHGGGINFDNLYPATVNRISNESLSDPETLYSEQADIMEFMNQLSR